MAAASSPGSANQPPARPAPAARRLLLLSWHFPPDPSVGANRWERLAEYAVARGWTVDVVTARREPDGPAAAARLAALPAGVRVVGFDPPPLGLSARLVAHLAALKQRRRSSAVGAASPSAPAAAEPAPTVEAPARGLRALRRVLFARRYMSKEQRIVRVAERTAASMLGDRPPTLVVSSGPPHLIHLAAARIARRAGVPHVVDMRDPWSLNELVPPDISSPWYFAENARLEAAVLRDAGLVVMNTGAATDAMRRAYPALGARVQTVMNGHDFAETPAVGGRDVFRIAYAGAVYADRSPETLFRALQALRAQGALDFARVRVEFMGRVEPSADALRALASRHGLDDVFLLHPPRSRDEAARFLESASVLLSLPQGAHLAIPSKVFEYSAYRAAMLVLATPGSATAAVLAGTRADVVDPDDPAAIAAALTRRYAEWAAGTIPAPVDDDGRFSRRHQARLLFEALDALAPVPRL